MKISSLMCFDVDLIPRPRLLIDHSPVVLSLCFYGESRAGQMGNVVASFQEARTDAPVTICVLHSCGFLVVMFGCSWHYSCT